MSDKLSFAEAVKNRRSIYSLAKKAPVSDARIKEIVTDVLLHTPSAFNSQSTRLVLLLHDDHEKFWDISSEAFKAVAPAEAFERFAPRIQGFKAAYATILFYEDPDTLKALQEKVGQYADKVPEWSEQTNAMHQYHAWTVLEAEGFGASLQHLNPLPNQRASETWKIPIDWQLKAQLVLGTPNEGARAQLHEKEQQPLEKRLFVHGA